jgi:F0F1-type ATP synthase alpha subunit
MRRIWKHRWNDTAGVLDGILHSHRPEIRVDDVGTVSFVGQGIVRVTGLRGVKSEELDRLYGRSSRNGL